MSADPRKDDLGDVPVKTHSGRPCPGWTGGESALVAASLEETVSDVLYRFDALQTTHHWTWATFTGATLESDLQGIGTGDRGSQYDSSCFASYSRIAGRRGQFDVGYKTRRRRLTFGRHDG